MLVKSDPFSAVDIYCKFPVSENLTFDDAYIFGEIVRLLMKLEKYDDPRLATNMISLGKVMGIGKYIIHKSHWRIQGPDDSRTSVFLNEFHDLFSKFW